MSRISPSRVPHWNKKTFFLLWGPVIAYTALIFWLSSRYRPIPGIELFAQMDKVCHAVEYFGLGILWLRALRLSWPEHTMRTLFWVGLLACLVTGVADELYQDLIPVKETDILDFSADAAGAFLGQILYGFSGFVRGRKGP